ncbi:hypothetical protein E4U41_003533 [Claviceps citrina]|nr:hypothetical protein E4U41_003533 [Claviceps citrina]
MAEENAASSREADIQYWTKHSEPVLRSLLRAAGSYTEEDTAVQLRILSQLAIPTMGPRPSKAAGPSTLTRGGTPFLPSINVSSKGNCVRYCWEMIGARGKDSDDPLAMQVTRDTVDKLAARFGLSTKWTDALLSTFALTRAEAQKVVEMAPRGFASVAPDGVGVEAPPTSFLFGMTGLDLSGSDVAMKLYVITKFKEVLTGKSCAEEVWDMLRSLKPAFEPEAIGKLQEFFDHDPDSSPFNMITIDCVKEAQLSGARVKIYVSTKSNAFRTVQNYVTLGGKLRDEETIKYLQQLHSVWHLLLQNPEGIPDDEVETPPTNISPFGHKLYFGIELRPGEKSPAIKTYIPTWMYARSDVETIRNYEAVFRALGHPWGEDGVYGKVFREVFGPPTHDRETTIHTDAAFLYSEKTGVYQTLYFSPPLARED